MLNLPKCPLLIMIFYFTLNTTIIHSQSIQNDNYYNLKQFEKSLIELFENNKESVVTITTQKKLENSNTTKINIGSGFIYDLNGNIVTSYGLIDSTNSDFRVKLHDNRIFPAKLVASDKSLNIGILNITSEERVKPIKINKSIQVKTGELAFLISSPMGFNNSFFLTNISRINIENNDISNLSNYIQLSTVFLPGFIGGPVFNLNGELIGILDKYTFSSNDESQKLAFAIPIYKIQPQIDELIKYGKVSRKFLGLTIMSLSSEDKRKLNISNGIIVFSITKKSPADLTGILINDIITKIDDINIDTTEDYKSAIQTKNIGDSLNVQILRKGKFLNYKIIVSEHQQ